jgi:hypothetical protein
VKGLVWVPRFAAAATYLAIPQATGYCRKLQLALNGIGLGLGDRSHLCIYRCVDHDPKRNCVMSRYRQSTATVIAKRSARSAV